MAQLVARLHGMQKVRGSNPLSSTSRTAVLEGARSLAWSYHETTAAHGGQGTDAERSAIDTQSPA